MFLIYLAVWIIFNGKFTWEIFFIGLVVSIGIEAFSIKFLEYSPKKTLRALKKLPRIIAYLFMLFVEIVKANIATIKLIFAVDEEPEPVIVKFHTPIATKTGRVVLANSITLTPGTITVKAEEDTFLVHALDKEFAEGIEDTVFQKKILKMEEE